MADIRQFPTNIVTPQDIFSDLQDRIEKGIVMHLLVVTMDKDTNSKTAMSTMPAYHAVYMNQLQRMSIENLMNNKDMIP